MTSGLRMLLNQAIGHLDQNIVTAATTPATRTLFSLRTKDAIVFAIVL